MLQNFCEKIYDTLIRNPEQVYLVWPVHKRAVRQATAGNLIEGAKKSYKATEYTGSAILNRISAYRSLLDRNKIQPGQEVLLVMPVNFELICALLAVMAHGAIPVLPPAGARPKDLFQILRKRPVKALLTAKGLNLLMNLLLSVLQVKRFNSQQAAVLNSEREAVTLVEGSQAALISHSSGSTAQAKAIIRTHQVLLAQHQALRKAFPPFKDQRDFPLFPNILLHNLSIGVKSVLPALPDFDILRMEPAWLLAQIEAEQIHTLTGNVQYFKQILTYLQQEPKQLSTVKALGIGGSPVPENLLRKLKSYLPKATLYVIYGSTEAEPIAVREVGSRQIEPAAGYAVGKFHTSLEWRIRPVSELLFGGRNYAVGEIEVKGAHVVTSRLDGWLQTGDYGYVNEQNELFLTGRKGNESVLSGVQHYQVEHFLQHQEGVERAAAIARTAKFEIYLQGVDIDRNKIYESLKEVFPEEIIGGVHIREKLAVDRRHHSKILYAQIS